MIEPPSKRLQERLTALNLCRRGDMRRCRRRVRKLARDLPAFDSVWIDALLQERRLTPFQARLLESPQTSEQLSIGPCVLVDQLGAGPGGETFLARLGNTKQRCVLKRVESRESRVERTESGKRKAESRTSIHPPPSSAPRPLPLDSPLSNLDSLQSLVARAGSVPHPNVVTPDKVIEHDGRLVVLSRFVAGTPLTELLIRRGRFPADVVREIGRQLIAGLACLESRKIVHGEVALWNVRLSSQGVATLVDAGIAPVVHPEILIDTESPPERFDGIAPERVATGNPATAASEIYALGCLLWQLLAGRPPFPTGDPLTKLAHHQTRPVADIREWVPDCPDALAELLTAMTAFEPFARPASFAELAEQASRSGRPVRTSARRKASIHAARSIEVRSGRHGPTFRGRRRLRRFHASFRAAVPRIRLRPAGSGFVRSATKVCAAVLLAAVGVGLLYQDVREPSMSAAAPLTDRITALTQPEPESESGKRKAESGTEDASALGLPLPAADANGVIALAGAQSYSWSAPLRSEKPIVIRGQPGKPATLFVRPGAAAVSAPGVVLQDVRLVVRAKPQAARGNLPAVVTVRADRLRVERCAIEASGNAAAIDWSPLSASAAGTQIVLKDATLLGGATVLRLRSASASIRCENVLHLGPGTLCRFTQLPPTGRTTAFALVHVTQRNAAALLRVDLPQENAAAGRIAISAKNCVFHFAGNNAALCVLGTSFPGQTRRGVVQFSGEGSLFPPGGRIAVESAVGPASAARVDNDAVQIDGGLLACEFEFAGPAGSNPATSVIARHRAPVRSQHTPGIDARRLMAIRP